MTYYSDLSEYTYHNGMFWRPGTKNVGWLAVEHPFPQAVPSEHVLDRIWQFCKVSIAQMRGLHDCEWCSCEAYRAERNGETLLLSTSEVRVFSRNGEIYAAPTLIYHYMKAHHYAPPEPFLAAVEHGPCPPDPAFFARLAELDLEWNPTSKTAGPRRRSEPPAK